MSATSDDSSIACDSIASSVAEISDAAGTISDLLADNRPLLRDTVNYLEGVQQPLVDQKQELNDLLVKFPQAVRILGRAGGIYGDFFNFYACDISLILNGLQPGGPVRKVKLTSQDVEEVISRRLLEKNDAGAGALKSIHSEQAANFATIFNFVDGAKSYRFRPIIIRECVGDRSAVAHEWTLFEIQARFADVVSLEEGLVYLSSLDAPKTARS